MGVDYNQYCYVGFKVDIEDLEVVVTPEVTEDQPQYDTKTGEITHYDTVVIKDEESHYKFYDLILEDADDMTYDIEERYDVSCHHDYDEETLLVGVEIGQELKEGWSRINLLDGEFSFDELNEIKNKVQEKFPDREISLVFYSHVG